MENKVILNNIPDEFTQKELGRGTSGICYLTKDGRVFKKLFSPMDNYDTLSYMSEHYKSDHLALPEQFVFLDNDHDNFIGYLRKYIEGKNFKSLDDCIEVERFIKALQSLEKEIIENTKRGLEYHDTHYANLLYTPEDEIEIIDPFLFDISYNDYDYKNRIGYTFMDIAYSINNKVLDVNNVNDAIDKLISKSYEYYASGFIKPSQLMYELAMELKRLTGNENQTLGDMRNNLKLVKGA